MRTDSAVTTSGVQRLRWLRRQQLAAIMLENLPEKALAADDPFSVPLLLQLARGWEVVARMADIVRHTRCRGDFDRAMGADLEYGTTSVDLETVKQHEMSSCVDLMRYVDSISLYEIGCHRRNAA